MMMILSRVFPPQHILHIAITVGTTFCVNAFRKFAYEHTRNSQFVITAAPSGNYLPSQRILQNSCNIGLILCEDIY